MERTIKRQTAMDEQVLERLLEQYSPLVYAVVKSVMGGRSRDEIEECVSDVFLYVYENYASLDFSRGSIKAYLCVTAKYRAIDRLNLNKRRAEVSLDACAELTSSDSVEEAALANADRSDLLAAIRALGEPETSLILHRYYFCRSSKEIGRIMEMSPDAVDQRLFRARKQLYRLLKGKVSYGEAK